ncbi:hypothetical protein BCR44DRAFT_1440315 [Catenaria anguillulae PL171]|uniref:Uncharacterized protein n=1 Tax=Catenaria anguillulae PL171 TaxID=765915 RepID=A0A1Y2HD89_9FUNG|nr:hypothetical protein BCR44DRAFT_1440315 [Catenaria anguillulae PL171]
MYSVTVLCPEWACRNATPTRTPGCPASTFIRTIPGLNSMGLFSYVFGAIHRFSRVYSAMSPLRHRIIQLFSTLAVIVLIARLSSVSMLAHVSFMPTSLAAPDSSRKEAGIEQIAGPIYTLVYSIFFTVLLVVDVGSTAISLHFVVDCRARLNVLALQASKSAPQTTGSLKSQAVAVAMDSDNDSVTTNLPTAASPSLALAVPDGPSSSSRRGSDRKGSLAASIPESPLLSLTSPRRKSSGTPMNTIPRDSLGLTSSGTTSAIHSTQERNRLGRRKRMKAAVSRVLALTAIKVTLFALFALVRFTPLLAGRISARLADAIVTIILKLFIAAATQVITTMTRLVALRH